MLVSVVNRTNSITDGEVQKAIRAINRQISEDFEPYWGFGGQLRLEGRIGDTADRQNLADLRGEAILYLWDHADVQNALGYHDKNASGIPYGFVFTELSAQLGEPWSVTLSHEALELLGDPQGNLLVQGPHPVEAGKDVYHWFEMCDAVQSQTYEIDGVRVANFVLPLYFTPGEQSGGRNDFLGAMGSSGQGLQSFGVAPGGYIGYYDPVSRGARTYAQPSDDKAKQRLAIKARSHYGRGFMRKQGSHVGAMAERHLKALAATPLAADLAAVDPIKHVVVLMLENQSFDRVLGGMSRINPQIEGVRDQKPYTNSGEGGQPVEQAARHDYVIARDLDHEHEAVLQQIAGGDMSGFVKSFLARYPDATGDELAQVMGYFPFGDTAADDALPAIHQLAREFAVCDHWFSAMPGPTWQNRFFAHSSTSLGHTQMPSLRSVGGLRFYYQETIFDRLSDAGISWRIFHDGVPQSIVLTRLLTRFLTWRGYDDMDDFFELTKGPADQFPAYSFIEPAYFGRQENDQHPPADMRDGEALIASVYNALRAKKELWESCLLVVLYDEHGGFFDHVNPPATVPPDAHTHEWAFDRLGVRVPAILVSPWVDKGVIKTVFDHTSLLRYLCDKWDLPPLGQRMQAQAGSARANSFASELTKRTTPRGDTPEAITVQAPLAAGMLDSAEPPIEGSREALLLYVQSLPDTGDAPVLKARARRGALLSPDEAVRKLQRLRDASPKK